MRSFLWLLALLALLAEPGLGQAATGPWVQDHAVRARLVTAGDAASRGDVQAGLQVALAPGWDTYWRSPGEAGAPPQLDWSASANVAGVTLRYPAPSRFLLFGIGTFGYLHEVVFPLTIHPKQPGGALRLRVTAELLVCSTVCVPKTLALSLDVPAGPAGTDAATANLLARYEVQVPRPDPGFAPERVTVHPGAAPTLAVQIASRTPMSAPDVIVESPRWSFGKPGFDFSPDRRHATALLPVTAGPEAVTMAGQPVVVTLLDGARASETKAAVAPGKAGGGALLGGLLPVLAVALLGGLILNAMPCVLPVLGLKLLTVLGQQGASRARVRLGFLATAAGIMASMLALGGVIATLKAAGATVGWGLQFQQPGFLIVMTAALVLFGASLAGLIEIPLPSRLATAMSRTGNGLGGNFVAGAFTTALATPCSAPFVGTAVAFALARGPGEIMAVFGALGLGLAVPHLGVAAFPGLVRLLPRPGRWMLALRRVLGLALAVTAAWLLTILADQTSWAAAGIVLVAILLLATALAARLRRPVAAGLAGIALVMAVAAPLLRNPAPRGATDWASFEPASIGKLVAEGHVVFVDVTARWCVTCQANRALVIDRPEVARALAMPGVVPMLADWTRPNASISGYLSKNNRFGIPFNAVYGPGAPGGIVLSEVLTPGAVIDALRRAHGTEISLR